MNKLLILIIGLVSFNAFGEEPIKEAYTYTFGNKPYKCPSDKNVKACLVLIHGIKRDTVIKAFHQISGSSDTGKMFY